MTTRQIGVRMKQEKNMTNDKIEKTRSKYTPNNKIMDENGEKFFVEMLLTKDKICPFMAKDSKSGNLLMLYERRL